MTPSTRRHLKVFWLVALLTLASVPWLPTAAATHTPRVAMEPAAFDPTPGSATFGMNVSNTGAVSDDAIYRVEVTAPVGYTLAATQPAAPSGWGRSAPVTVAGRDFIVFNTTTARDPTVSIRPAASLVFSIAVSAFDPSVTPNGTAATWSVVTQDTSMVPGGGLELGQRVTSAATSTADTTAPEFREIVVPAFAKAGAMTLTFRATEAMGADPTVTILGRAATRLSGPSPYSYTFTVLAADANGPTTATITGADVAGHPATATSGAFTIDTVAPSVWANASCATPGGAGWCRSDVVLSAAASDATSGVGAPTCTLSGASDCARTITADGASYAFTATATDAAGNAFTTPATTFKIDKTAPTLAVAQTCAAGRTNDWCLGDINVGATHSDTGSGGSVATCAIDGAAPATCPPAFTVEGQHTMVVNATDAAGNVASSTQTLRVDKTAPTVTAGAACALVGTDGWCRGDVALTATVTDPGDDAPAPAACKLNGATAACAQTLVLDGEYTFVADAVDRAGRTDSDTKTFKVDRTAADVTTTATCATPGAPGWCLGDVALDATASDAGSALTVSCTLDGAASPCARVVSVEGAHAFVASATDRAGNPAARTTAVNVDKTAPGIALQSRTPAANAAGWNDANVTLVFTCTDAASGPVDATLTILVDEEGAALSRTATCVDVAGRSASTTVSGIKVDKTAPGIALTAQSPPANPAGWNVGPVTLTWTCTDAHSGVVQSTITQTVTAAGLSTLSATCVDLAGNAASAEHSVRIDDAAPSVTVALSTSPSASGWHIEPTTATLTGADTQSGLAALAYSLDGVTFRSGATVALPDGELVLIARATDAAGRTTARLVAVKVDTTPPVATFPAGDERAPGDLLVVRFNEAMDATSAFALPAGWTGAWGDGSTTYSVRVPAGAEGAVDLALAAGAKDAHGVATTRVQNATYTIVPPPPPPPPAAGSGALATEPAPDAPAGLRASAVQGGIRLAWDAAPRAQGYHLYRDGALLLTVLLTERVDTSVEPGATHEYAVRAFNAGGESALSSSVRATRPLPPPAPTLPTAQATVLGEADAGGVYRVAPRVSLAAREGALVYYRLDGGARATYASPFAIPDGEHVLTYWAEDAVGSGPLGRLALRVQTVVAPTPTPTPTPTPPPSPTPTPPAAVTPPYVVVPKLPVDETPLDRTSVADPTPPDESTGELPAAREAPGASALVAIGAALALLAAARRPRR